MCIGRRHQGGDTQPDLGTDQSEHSSTRVPGRPTGPLEDTTVMGRGRGSCGEVGPVAAYPLAQMCFNILITGIVFLVPTGRTSVLLSPKIELGD